MKKLILLLLIFGKTSFAQEFIQKKDGTKTDVSNGSIYIESDRNKVAYLLKDDKKVRYVKFKDLDYASYGGILFKSFLIDKKQSGYFVISEYSGKTLVTSKQTKIKNRGGFESTYSQYKILVLNTENQIMETLSFTDTNSVTSIGNRSNVVSMIKNHFSGCSELMERVSLFESPASDLEHTIVLTFMNDPKLVNCN